MKSQFSLIILSLFFLLSCSENEDRQKYKESQKMFMSSIKTFSNINENISGQYQDAITGKDINQNKIVSEIKKGIEESKLVTDDYLYYLHPNLRLMYRENFVGGYELLIENINNRDLAIASKLDEQISEKHQLFWQFMGNNQESINAKTKKIKQKNFVKKIITPNENKKSFLRFFTRLFFSGVISITIFSIIVLILISPIALIGAQRNISKILVAPFTAILGIGSVYFWLLWAAYCAYTVQFYTNSPDVSQHWIYYILGFIASITPISWFIRQELLSNSMHEIQKPSQRGSTYYRLITMFTYIIFSVWTNLLQYNFISWFNDWIFYS